MTIATPLKQSPLSLIRNAMGVCTAYEDGKHVAPESAQQQLPRIHALLCMVEALLGEPYSLAVARMGKELEHAASEAWRAATRGAAEPPAGFINERWARDSAAIICRTQITWGIGEGFPNEP